MIEYILKFILLVVVGYWIYWFLIGHKKPNGADKVRADYKNILDSKLIPLGFEYRQMANGGKENVVSYTRDYLEVILHYEPVFNYNRVEAKSGKTVTLQEHINRLPPDMKNMIMDSQGFDGTQLVTGTDFSLELSDSENAKRNFIENLDTWLVENNDRTTV